MAVPQRAIVLQITPDLLMSLAELFDEAQIGSPVFKLRVEN